MTITGLPAYRSPIEQSFRCPQCERRYLICNLIGLASEC
jgi:DNA polymerase II large subunit